jgi:hypothetical protein
MNATAQMLAWLDVADLVIVLLPDGVQYIWEPKQEPSRS